MFSFPVDAKVTHVAVPWSHSKYISPDSAQPPEPPITSCPPIVKLAPVLISGSTVGRVIVTPEILIAIRGLTPI